MCSTRCSSTKSSIKCPNLLIKQGAQEDVSQVSSPCVWEMASSSSLAHFSEAATALYGRTVRFLQTTLQPSCKCLPACAYCCGCSA
jgi:hypothetical protein